MYDAISASGWNINADIINMRIPVFKQPGHIILRTIFCFKPDPYDVSAVSEGETFMAFSGESGLENRRTHFFDGQITRAVDVIADFRLDVPVFQIGVNYHRRSRSASDKRYGKNNNSQKNDMIISFYIDHMEDRKSD